YGGPEMLQPEIVHVPPPGPGEVRLSHTAIGVNFIDIYSRTGFLKLLPPPRIPGMEAAAVVTRPGSGGAHPRVGDRVAYACEPVGAYSEHRTMSARLLVPVPDDIDDETVAAIFLKGLASEFLLHTVHALRDGETVLIHAVSGGTGLILCQWA